ncbi:hypothetical protein A2U01_0089721, partial [Trifolium medium]|nr:hypothetical protein [Trifolium medium]
MGDLEFSGGGWVVEQGGRWVVEGG